jgi:uncharacterized membrane-anchored protein YitT (DUF2179 family)
VAWNLALISVGSACVAVAANGLLIPHGFVSGGFLGLSMALHYLWPVLPVGALYIVFNLPIYALGWRLVGKRFFAYSVAGAFIFAAAVQYVQVTLPVTDRILAAVLAGIISGAGGGLILRSLGSAGGIDILAVILLKRYSLRVGNTMLGFNVAVLSALAFISSLEAALYTFIHFYVTARVTDVVVMGLSQRKAVIIVSQRWQEIVDRVLVEINRGATLLQGQGAYSGQTEQVIYTVVTLAQLPQLKALVLRVDPEAFLVVSETSEVMGRGIGNQPHW